MKKKTATQQPTTQQPKWPTTLYLTPDGWRDEVLVVDERKLRHMVIELRRLGGDWRRICMNDATPIRLVNVQDDSTAVYGYGVHPTLGGGKLYRVRRHRDPNGVRYEWEEVRR